MNSWLLVLAHAAALALDGYSTHRYVQMGGYVERDPLVRPLLGARPSDGRMIALGAVELAGTTYLVRKHPKLKWMQISLIAAHGGAGAANFRLTEAHRGEDRVPQW